MFIPIKQRRLVLALGLMCCLGAQADKTPKPVMTLGDLIEQAKQQQMDNLTAAAKPALSASPITNNFSAEMLSRQSKPMLWSLTGVNHQLVAEVIYNQQVHVLRLHEGDREIGPWLIERYSNNGLQLVLAKNKKTSLYLRPPIAGTTLERYASELPNTNNSNLPLGTPKVGDIVPSNVLSQNTNNNGLINLLKSSTGTPGQPGKTP